jgi:hypothetical protein
MFLPPQFGDFHFNCAAQHAKKSAISHEKWHKITH